jgi:predicted Rossmann fold flavoprotein
MGATGFGHELARQFGLKIRECRPALVPLVFAPLEHKRYGDLSGVATEVIASFPPDKHAPSFREKMLITHRGLSGPAILQISSYWQPGKPISLDLAPANNAPGEEAIAPLLAPNARRDLASVRAALRNAMPNRLADRWMDHNPPSAMTTPALTEFERKLHQWEVTPAGTEGYEKAEVTAGGVDTAELDAKTMQSRKVPGLYFIGEVVDVTGHLGGFNFQWAWASGFSAGQAI